MTNLPSDPFNIELDQDDASYLRGVILSCKNQSGYFIYRFTFSLNDSHHSSGEFWVLDIDPEGVFLREPDNYHDYDHPENTSRHFMKEAREGVYPVLVSPSMEDLTPEKLIDAFNEIKTKRVLDA